MQVEQVKEDFKPQQCQLIPKKMIEHYSYALHDQIGRGFSSKVFMGKNEKTGEVVAVKVIDMKGITNDVERSLLQQEINALKMMNSPNILKLFDYYHTSNNTYLITEYCNQGDLESVLQKCGTINEAEAAKILKHIMNGFKEQIKKGIIHRDLKPANIFIRNGIPKIADFGFSKMMNAPKEKVYYNVGTPLYMSPQTIINNKYSEKSDMWSIGVLYYELLYGKVPWQASSEKQLVDVIQSQQPFFNPKINVSEESINFLKRSLHLDEDLRISIKEIEQHPLFLRRNTTTFSKPRALLSNTYNSNINSNSVDKNPNISMQLQPKAVSPERRITSYARQSETGQGDALRSRDPHHNSRPRVYENSNGPRIPSILRPFTINEKMEVEVTYVAQSSGDHVSQQHRVNKSQQMGKMLIPGTTVNTPSSKINHLFGKSPLKGVIFPENKLKPTIVHIPTRNESTYTRGSLDNVNMETVQCQIYVCKFLYRIVQIIEHYSFFSTAGMQGSLNFLILKNIMIKMAKLKDMVENGNNPLKLDNFAGFLESGGLTKISQTIGVNYTKYGDNFNKIRNQIIKNMAREEPNTDTKFLDIFNMGFQENESFYLFLQQTLRSAIRELNHKLNKWMESIKDNEDLSTEIQAGLILLDYMVVYHVMAQIIMDNMENPQEFAKVSRMEILAEGRPSKLTKQTFVDVRQRIQQLKI